MMFGSEELCVNEVGAFKKAFDSVLEEESPQFAPKSATKTQAPRWNPYSFELGTIAGISGENFVVVASDTRLSFRTMGLLTRSGKKLHILTDSVAFGGCMFYGDTLALIRNMKARMMQYNFDFREEMKADTMAEMLSRTLYGRRFFPYYSWTILAGIDSKGKGAVYSYDPVGNLERIPYCSAGSAHGMVTPFLDNQIGWVTQEKSKAPEMSIERAQALMKDAFRSAAERETCTGDKVHLVTLVHGKPAKEEWIPLRED